MTFEEWLDQNKQCCFEPDTIYFLRQAWNAAIASSLNAVDAVNKSNIDENDVLVYIHEDLKKLLTA